MPITKLARTSARNTLPVPAEGEAEFLAFNEVLSVTARKFYYTLKSPSASIARSVVTHFGFVAPGFSPACAALTGGATSKCVTTCV
jgi:hypothetical protein